MQNKTFSMSITSLLALTIALSAPSLATELSQKDFLPKRKNKAQLKLDLSSLSSADLLETQKSASKLQDLAIKEMVSRLRKLPEISEQAFQSSKYTTLYYKEYFVYNNQAERDTLKNDIENIACFRCKKSVKSFGNIIFYAAQGSFQNLNFLMNLSEHENFRSLLKHSKFFACATSFRGIEECHANQQISEIVQNNIDLLVKTIGDLFTSKSVATDSDEGIKLLSLRDKIQPFGKSAGTIPSRRLRSPRTTENKG